jgi:hypothetical protein
MNYKILTILLLSILFFTTNTYAEDFNINYYYNNLDDAKDKFIANTEKMPDFLKNAIEKEKIRFDIKGIDGTDYSVIWEKTKDGYQFTKNNLEDFSLKIKTTEQELNKIINSDKTADQITYSLKNKKLDLEAKGFWSNIKLGVSKIALKIADWFT